MAGTRNVVDVRIGAGIWSNAFSFCLHRACEFAARVISFTAGPVALEARIGAGLAGENSVYGLIPFVTVNATVAIGDPMLTLTLSWGRSKGVRKVLAFFCVFVLWDKRGLTDPRRISATTHTCGILGLVEERCTTKERRNLRLDEGDGGSHMKELHFGCGFTAKTPG